MHALDKVDQLMKMLQQMLPIPADRKNILDKKFRLEFNYNSNHIEGNTLTYGETELLLIFDDTKGNHQMREYEEMKAHDVAYKMIEEWAADKERPLTEQQIKNLNQIILVRPYWKDAVTSDGQPTRRQIRIGDYKEMPNSVRLANGEIFHYAAPAETPIQMQELIDWYSGEIDAVHPVTLAAMLHYRFVRIHPFDDGNGRIARLLLNYVLLRNGYPPVIIKSADKTNYLQALHMADIGDYSDFIYYIAEQLIWSLEISIKAAKGESIDEPGDLDKKLAALKKRIRQQGKEKVLVKYDRETVIDTVRNLKLLISELENKLTEFDTFFYSRLNTIQFIDSSSIFSTKESGFDLNTVYDKIANNFFGIDINSIIVSFNGLRPTNLSSIGVYVDYKNLRSTNSEKNYSIGGLIISFHPNVFDIRVDDERLVSKLYDEQLNSEEINLIVESIGNRLVSNIEKEIEEKGTK